jgi:hypothetical protein
MTKTAERSSQARVSPQHDNRALQLDNACRTVLPVTRSKQRKVVPPARQNFEGSATRFFRDLEARVETHRALNPVDPNRNCQELEFRPTRVFAIAIPILTATEWEDFWH